MKRLSRMVLVNWYLLEAVEIVLENHTAFVGPNASGKSSILDAIQTVLLGGHGHYVSLNPSAGEKSHRSIRDYCLGVVKHPDIGAGLSADLRPREQATTYLVLNFFDDQDNTETAVGLAMHASEDQARERIDGRFILPGHGVSLDDLITSGEDGPVPRPWSEVRELLHQRGPLQTDSHPGEFVRRVGVALSADGKQPFDHRRFLKNFKNAMTFAPISNVSEFVRRFILEARPIQVGELQESLRCYQEIYRKTAEVKARIGSLQAIEKELTCAIDHRRRHCLYRWSAAQACVAHLQAVQQPLHDRLMEITALRRELEQACQRQSERVEELSTTEQRLRRLKDGDGENAALLRTETLAEVNRQIDRCKTLLADVLEYRARIRSLAAESALFPAVCHERLAALGRLVNAAGEAVDFSAVKGILGDLDRQLRDAIEQQRQDKETLVSRRRERAGRTAGDETGDAAEDEALQRLRRILKEDGIDARPLFERIDVKDERWRDALERCLGPMRNVLLVAPEDFAAAARGYQQWSSEQDVCEAGLVNAAVLGEPDAVISDGSLADAVITDDRLAQRFCRHVLGTVKCVDSVPELLRHDNAVTTDGVVYREGVLRRLPRVAPKRGCSTPPPGDPGDRAQADAIDRQIREVEERLAGWEALREATLLPLLHRCPDHRMVTHLEATLRRLEEERQVREKQDSAADDARERWECVCEALADARQRVARLQAQLTDLAVETGQLQQQSTALDLQITQARERAAALAASEHFAGDEAAEVYRRLQRSGGPAEWQKRARRLAEQAASQADQHERRALTKVADYQARFSTADVPADVNTMSAVLLRQWARAQIGELESTALADYEQQARQAMVEAELSFRGEFVGRLQDNLRMLHDKLYELNRTLEKCPFHGDTYRFVAKPNREFLPVLEWIDSLGEVTDTEVAGWFSGEVPPQTPHAEAINQIRHLLFNAGSDDRGHEALADYRNYYTFDVHMIDGEGNVAPLSKRIGRGSGGEHQSPFYVAIGAALAATYRLYRREDGSVAGGMALAVFDEAFSKLDVQNTTSALRFLDELGLQVILAAPDEKHALMSEHMNTIVNVYRCGGTVEIDVEYPSDRARRLLAADNPLH